MTKIYFCRNYLKLHMFKDHGLRSASPLRILANDLISSIAIYMRAPLWELFLTSKPVSPDALVAGFCFVLDSLMFWVGLWRRKGEWGWGWYPGWWRPSQHLGISGCCLTAKGGEGRGWFLAERRRSPPNTPVPSPSGDHRDRGGSWLELVLGVVDSCPGRS